MAMPRRDVDMTTYAVLLRGVNVGRHNRISMPDLRRVLEGLGGTDVRTYVQSGNAVLRWPGTPPSLEQQVAAALEAELGLRVPVMVRTAAELDAVVAGNPWADEDLDPKRFQVAFLSGPPDPARLAAVDHEALLPERLAAGDRVLYLWHAEGVQRSKLERVRLGDVEATSRNWTTVTALRDLTR